MNIIMNTKKVSHTPGPWRISQPVLRVKKDSDWATDIYAGTRHQSNHQCVCVAVQASVRDQKEAEGNAGLIAAAPELLEALRMIYKDLAKISPKVFDEEISELAKTRVHHVLSKLKDL